MNRMRQLLTIAEMQGRDLLRRRGALLMLAAMPLAFYFALLGKGGYAITTGGRRHGVLDLGAALFSMLAAKRIEPRLVLAGYRPLDLLLGRLLLLEALGLVIVLLTTALMTVVSRPPHPEFVLAGIALTVWVAVPLGLAIATLIARELEGVLAAIAVVGVQLLAPDRLAGGPVPAAVRPSPDPRARRRHPLLAARRRRGRPRVRSRAPRRRDACVAVQAAHAADGTLSAAGARRAHGISANCADSVAGAIDRDHTGT